MCGRFTSLLFPELLSVTFGVAVPQSCRPRYNIAPTQQIPVIREERDEVRRLSFVRWGQSPSWANDLGIGSNQINTAAETLTGDSDWNCLSNNCRCLIPANGFYIWQDGEDRKQPWYVTRKDGAHMALAGLLSRWRTPGGNEIDTCSVITTAANGLIRPIHDRMPATISSEDFSLWLSASRLTPADYRALLKSEPSDTLDIYSVGSQVNQPAFDTNACIRNYRSH